MKQFVQQGEYMIQIQERQEPKPHEPIIGHAIYKSATRYEISTELQEWIKKNPKEKYIEGVDFKMIEEFTGEVLGDQNNPEYKTKPVAYPL